MQSTYRLKTPIFISLTRDGHTREESIRYLTVRGPIAAMLGDPVDDDSPNDPEKVEGFMRRLDLEDRDQDEDRRFLTHGDLDVAVDDAFRAARWRAADFIWGKNQMDDPAARCPRDFDGPSEAEAKARMIASFGFDFTPDDGRNGEAA